MYRNMEFEHLRQFCKAQIESLEMWLRRLIDIELRENFGEKYLWYQYGTGNDYLIKRSVRENVIKRTEEEPKRYPREIDAILLDDAVNILLHQNLYQKYFRQALSLAFPDGPDEARTFFNRIIVPRNHLSHANPISVRQAEQVICYSNDIIDSLKHYFERKGLQKMYNVPRIIQLTDSKGNSFFEAQIKNNQNSTGRSSFNLQTEGNNLYPGETLRIEIQIDPSFNPNDYRVDWIYTDSNPTPVRQGLTFDLEIKETHIREDFTVYCSVTSINKNWHRLGDCDDSISVTYRVLPPLEV